MNKFDIKTARFIVIILFICITFAVVVMQAYQYLPEENTKSTITNKVEEDFAIQENTNNYNEESQTKENTDFEDEKESEKPQTQRRELRPEKDLELIPELNQDSNKDETTNSLYTKALEQKNSNEYKKAIENFKIVAETADNITKANCYQQIAIIHAIEKHYGTALSFAQKAYNTSPSTERELLLARLYYKTGNVAQASTRVNNILKRDFELDK